MAKRKPLSGEEKKCKILELFHESSDVLQLKDVERLASKEKGIAQQLVKAIVKELVDEGQIYSAKMASNTIYWSFPNQVLNSTTQRLEESEMHEKQLQSKIESMEKKLKETTEMAKNAEEIAAVEKEIQILHNEKAKLNQRLTLNTNSIDCAAVAEKEKSAKEILIAANRWTDNVFLTKSWCKRKFDKEDRELNKAFGIPDDLDYLENA